MHAARFTASVEGVEDLRAFEKNIKADALDVGVDLGHRAAVLARQPLMQIVHDPLSRVEVVKRVSPALADKACRSSFAKRHKAKNQPL